MGIGRKKNGHGHGFVYWWLDLHTSNIQRIVLSGVRASLQRKRVGNEELRENVAAASSNGVAVCSTFSSCARPQLLRRRGSTFAANKDSWARLAPARHAIATYHHATPGDYGSCQLSVKLLSPAKPHNQRPEAAVSACRVWLSQVFRTIAYLSSRDGPQKPPRLLIPIPQTTHEPAWRYRLPICSCRTHHTCATLLVQTFASIIKALPSLTTARALHSLISTHRA